MFEGSNVAIVTPFSSDGSVDFGRLGELIEFQIENGTHGIVPCGTTGEAATQSHEEHIKVVEFTVEKVNGRANVIAGIQLSVGCYRSTAIEQYISTC